MNDINFKILKYKNKEISDRRTEPFSNRYLVLTLLFIVKT